MKESYYCFVDENFRTKVRVLDVYNDRHDIEQVLYAYNDNFPGRTKDEIFLWLEANTEEYTKEYIINGWANYRLHFPEEEFI